MNIKTNWTANDYINFDDLNRMELNTQTIRDRLIADGYNVPAQTYKTNWAMSDIVYNEDLNRIENNIKTLAQIYCTNEEFEQLKTNWQVLESVTFTAPQRIEKDLQILDMLINSMEQYYIRCGVARCGQNRVWQHRFRGSKTWNRIPFNTFNDVPEPLQVYTICNINDSANIEFKGDGSAYGNVLYYNNSINELDNIIGDVNG